MLSIIVPTLNEEKIIARTLKSLKNLDICDYEIIVSDGHSSDRTLAIASRYTDKLVAHDGKVRQNIAQGRNAGTASASGRYFVFIDADVSIPDINTFFDRALAAFEKNPKLVGLTVFMKVFPEHATLSDGFFFSLINWLHYVFNNFLRVGIASGEFQMIRADAFRQVGGYNEKLVMGEDVEMFSQLAKIGRTRTEAGLHVLHTSRRAHNLGWTKLLALWWTNAAFNKIFKHSLSKEWKVIR